MPVDRRFVLVANRADPSGKAPLDDLAGAGGRFDLVARFVTVSLLTSHGIREDTEAVVLFTDAEPDPVALRVRGSEAVGLRPDERSTAARLNDALAATAMPVWQDVADGIALKATDLTSLLAEGPDPVVELDQGGRPLAAADLDGGTFVLGDQDDLTEAQQESVQEAADHHLSVGPVALQADQVVPIVHSELDRLKGG